LNKNDPKVIVAEHAHEIYKRGLATVYGGIISMRKGNKMYITPAYYPLTERSITCLIDLEPEDIIVLNLEGKKLEGTRNPSPETDSHLLIYNTDPETNGICHTHQIYASAFATAGLDLTCWTDSPRSHIGMAPLVEVRPMGSEWLSLNIKDGLEGKPPRACLLRNHGVWCKGATITEALHIAHQLEEAAKTQIFATLLRTDAFASTAKVLHEEAKFFDNMYKEEARIKKKLFGIDYEYPRTERK
jgi:ribulose-5-phosphate 4-epimerase/fuculose-1-phosphate aldolase